MGQYKVPQDVEAEDKIIGPLTLKQFLYTVGGVIWAFASWALFHSFLPLMLLIGLPPTFLLLLLGLYRRQDQPFEIYFVSLVGFIGRPRQRIWQKDDVVEGLRIEAPKAVVEQTQRDPGEVRSHLEQLTQVVDTRGWASKESSVQEPIQTVQLNDTDRLYLPEPIVMPEISEVKAADDMLDMDQNPAARTLGVLIENHAKSIRDEALAKMRIPVAKSAAISDVRSDRPLAPAAPARAVPVVMAAAATPVQPVATVPLPAPAAPSQASTSGMTANPFDAILKLAMEESDLKVSQIAAQANRQATIPENQTVSVRDAAQQPSPNPATAAGQ